MRSKSKAAGETQFDRRRTSSSPRDSDQATPGRRATDRRAPATAAERRDTPTAADDTPRQRRTTRDGRQPLVVYLQPQSIKALKMFALENDTTASAIVADAVESWLRVQSRR